MDDSASNVLIVGIQILTLGLLAIAYIGFLLLCVLKKKQTGSIFFGSLLLFAAMRCFYAAKNAAALHRDVIWNNITRGSSWVSPGQSYAISAMLAFVGITLIVNGWRSAKPIAQQ